MDCCLSPSSPTATRQRFSFSPTPTTISFLLGNLEDFDAETMLVPFEDLPEVDRYMLHLTRAFVEDVNAGYSALSFQRVTQNLNQLSVNDLSGFYFEMIKDRLYLEHRTGHSRRSVQTVLHHLLTSFRTALLPIACHLGEELYHFAKGVDPAVADPGTLTSAMQDPPTELSGDWEQPALASRWTAIRGLRSAVFRAIHTARAEGHVHTSADACVHLVVSSAEAAEWIAGLLQPNAYGDTLLNAVCLTSRVRLWQLIAKPHPVPTHNCLFLHPHPQTILLFEIDHAGAQSDEEGRFRSI